MIDLDRHLSIEDNPTVVVPLKEIQELEATANRLRGLLMRLRELEMYAPAAHDPGECPDCDLAREIDKALGLSGQGQELADAVGSQD